MRKYSYPVLSVLIVFLNALPLVDLLDHVQIIFGILCNRNLGLRDKSRGENNNNNNLIALSVNQQSEW